MEQARAVLERLERIDALRQEEAPAGVVLGEVRALLTEAEAWVEADRGDSRAVDALERSQKALEQGEKAVSTALFAR